MAEEGAAAGRLRPLLPLALALGAGFALGQAPWGLWWLAIPALAAALWLAGRAPPRRAAWIGLGFGIGWFALALHWIVFPFLVDPWRHGWLIPLALPALAGGLALFPAAAFGLAARYLPRGPLSPALALAAAEVLRGHLFTGFPWAAPGHVWIDTPALALAPLAGAEGLTLLAVLAAALLAALWSRLPALAAAGGAALAAGLLLTPSPAPLPAAAAAPSVRLAASGVAQTLKWDPEAAAARVSALTAAARGAPGPVIWSETALPWDPALFPEVAATVAEAAGRPVLTGTVRREGGRPYNAVVAIGAGGGVLATYDKHHLVPFGEYVPLGNLLGRMGIRGLADTDGMGFGAGPGPQVIEVPGLGSVLPLICYEAIFPRNLRTDRRADVIVHLTNDGWFGRGAGPDQHFAQARLRAAETGLPMLRVANRGWTGAIDARGGVVRAAKATPGGIGGGFGGAVMDVALPPALPPTPYARLGDWPSRALLLLALGGLAIGGAREGRLVPAREEG
ncbi:apolipoprotein N-acyltransferase [Hasllibacter halocynthiae]|uniref:Apolipoprotein N-acyltransferase n=1 Tax=Hasllibacter halocynthiae TaxID=595589 RepID=A0A2T0X187_9RHOB|nr:apolipoprotein N-acyltransferase [Hasllibacter halocynthiae]PRY92655.1 apolipoprotein N-acyltransferase [Hasllibacter halocynthiae]